MSDYYVIVYDNDNYPNDGKKLVYGDQYETDQPMSHEEVMIKIKKFTENSGLNPQLVKLWARRECDTEEQMKACMKEFLKGNVSNEDILPKTANDDLS